MPKTERLGFFLVVQDKRLYFKTITSCVVGGQPVGPSSSQKQCPAVTPTTPCSSPRSPVSNSCCLLPEAQLDMKNRSPCLFGFFSFENEPTPKGGVVSSYGLTQFWYTDDPFDISAMHRLSLLWHSKRACFVDVDGLGLMLILHGPSPR